MAPRPEKKERKGDAGKKSASKKRPSQKWKAYSIEGDRIVRKLKSCPKCGEGVHLGQHKDRASCGKCGYTEFAKKA
jgi:ubiquitin-small subunit ribosomal protein S27Ae